MVEISYQQKQTIRRNTEFEFFAEKLKGTSILFIEDEYVNLLYFSELLAETGVTFYTAYSFTKALDHLQKFNNISLVVVSSSVAKRSNYDLIRMLKQYFPDLPIITIIMNDGFRIESACLESGSDLYLSRYTDKNNLMEAIVELLSENNMF
jgi:CheY-like chemotaxis protein